MPELIASDNLYIHPKNINKFDLIYEKGATVLSVNVSKIRAISCVRILYRIFWLKSLLSL